MQTIGIKTVRIGMWHSSNNIKQIVYCRRGLQLIGVCTESLAAMSLQQYSFSVM